MAELRHHPLALPVALFGLALVAGLVGFLFGIEILFLGLAGLTLLLVIVLLWQSLQSLSLGSELSLEEALSLAAPAIEQERKQAVLRALKDLDYERSVGKLSDEDYAELAQRYRAEAKELMRALDERGKLDRERILRRLDERVAQIPDQQPDEPPSEMTSRGCPACSGENDLDARFCKHCGDKLVQADVGGAA
jgi:hypothetical protein